MRYLYSCFLYALVPFLWFRLKWKGRSLPAYRQRISERFVLNTASIEPVDIWLHAVSLGEVIAAAPLIEIFLKQALKVLVTTMTPTGSTELQRRFGERVFHQYAPYDLPIVVKRFYRAYKPKRIVILETELWPNWIHYARQFKIPLFLANACLSERSYRQYLKLRFFFKDLLNCFTGILAQHEEDAARYRALGAQADKVSVLGNVKFDLQSYDLKQQQPAYEAIARPLQKRWGDKRVVLILASTHEGEEEVILPHVKKLQKVLPQLILLIAPRHPERFQKVYALCQHWNFNVGLRSKPETIHEENEIVVLDSLGELLTFYQLSQYAFVGGSLVPIGGHNVLEAIAMKVPVFCGPHFDNFKSVCHALIQVEAIQFFQKGEEFVEKIGGLHKNALKKQQILEAAMHILQVNQGAVRRQADIIWNHSF